MKRILQVWQMRDAVRLTHLIQTGADNDLKREGVRLALLTVLSRTTPGLVLGVCKEGVFDLRMRQSVLTAGQPADALNVDELNGILNRYEFLEKEQTVIPISQSSVRVNYARNAPDRKAYRNYLARIAGVEKVTALSSRIFDLDVAERVDLRLMEEIEARASFTI